MDHINIRHLKLAGACSGQVDLFREIFGESVSFSSKEEAIKLAVKHAQDFDFDFIGMETGGTQVKVTKPSNNTKFKEGDTLVCTKSASCAYTEGVTYKAYKNDKGWLCITGDDGLEDILSMVVSNFKVKE